MNRDSTNFKVRRLNRIMSRVIPLTQKKKTGRWCTNSRRKLMVASCAAVICAWTSGSIYAATRSLGIDVSSYQGTVNWAAVKSDGIDFAWAKATEGSAGYVNYTDAYLNANMAGANSAGVLIGAYHFAHPINDSGAAGAQAEADLFIEKAGQYMTAGYLRPVLDIEVEGSSATSAWVNDFLDDVDEATGVTPLIYTYSNYAAEYLNTTVANRDLWMADYSGASSQTGAPAISPPFNNWNFWQYTDAATVNGVAGGVDGDVANGNLAYVQSFLIPAQAQIPGAVENATAVTWTGGGINGSWSNAANWSSAWTAGSVAEFTSSSVSTSNITFDQAASGNKVVNVAQINVADTNAPAVTINGSDPIEFQTYVDPIYNNSQNTLTINAPTEFFGTMGTAANAGTNSIYAGPGNIVLGGKITFNDSQTQVTRFGFNDLIAVWDSHINKVPGNLIISGTISDAAGTPTGYTNGMVFSNAGGYDDVTSNNANWRGGMYVTGGATLMVSAGASTGTGAVTLYGAGSGNNGLQPAGIHGGIAGEGTVSGPVTVTGSGGFFTGGGKLINNFSTFSPTTGKLTLAAGLNMDGQTATFNFYLSGTSSSSLSIGDIFTLSDGDSVALSGTPTAGTYHLIDFNTLANAVDLTSWTITGPSGFNYLLSDNSANRSLDVIATAVPEPASLALLGAGLAALISLRRRRASGKTCIELTHEPARCERISSRDIQL